MRALPCRSPSPRDPSQPARSLLRAFFGATVRTVLNCAGAGLAVATTAAAVGTAAASETSVAAAAAATPASSSASSDAAATAASAAPGAPQARPSARARPNFLFILADNWYYPHSSFLGDRTIRTPTFDRIAREGVFFENAYGPVPSCSPTRAAILTGRYAHELGEAVNLWSGFPAQHRLFTDELRKAGYQVGYTGKGWAPGNYFATGRTENPIGRRFPDFARFLAAKPAEQPFFFWLGNVDTAIGQWDYDPARVKDLDPASVVVPPHLPDTPLVRANILAYYDRVRRLDAVAGAAVAQLEKHGLMERTIIVYTSDNGWQVPRGLANCYDDGSHVPLAVWGKALASGRRLDAFINLHDLGPTLLQLAGLEPLPEMTARSFADLLRGHTSKTKRDAVFMERERHANVRRGDLGYPMRAIRTKDHLLILNLRPERWPAGDPEKHVSVGPYGDVDNGPIKDLILASASGGPHKRHYDLVFAKRPAEELYDLRRDPDQVTNVADQAEYAAVKAALKGRIFDWMRRTADPRVEPGNDRPDAYFYHGDVNTWDKDNYDGAHLFGNK